MSPMARRLASLLTVLLLAAAIAPAAASADGDPASDVLLGENVFYPYTPPVPASTQATLNAATVAAKKAGLPIKVALIASPVDLGVIPELFGKPQSYADFLDKEISFQGVQPLLVVMAAGYGVQGMPPAAMRAAKTLPLPKGKTSADLAQAAIAAVAKLSAAAGHPISGVPGAAASSSGGGSSTTVILIGLVVVALLVSAGLLVLRRRRPAAAPAQSQR
jgi:hypothetical protein